jgi:ribosomal protein S12
MPKSDKKTEKKADSKAKAEVKSKVVKKVKTTDAKKPVSAIPSAKHAAPISSKEILARVCTHHYFLK